MTTGRNGMRGTSVLHVRQGRAAILRALTSDRTGIILVRNGEKRVSSDLGRITVPAGWISVLPARHAMTVENLPPAVGPYRAQLLLPSDQAVLDFGTAGHPMRASRDDRIIAAFDRAVTALDDPFIPPALREHAVREVVLWLADAGIGPGLRRRESVADRVRDLILSAPDAEWKASEAARTLAMSEATLRRKLANAGTGFADIVADVRMTHALGLLQTTDLPVNRIALDVGYASASRFALRFKARFGISPSDLRAVPTGESRIDRIGTAIERIGEVDPPLAR